jgi:hypothetical protein
MLEQMDKWGRARQLEPSRQFLEEDSQYYAVYPECGDVIVEQRRSGK